MIFAEEIPHPRGGGIIVRGVFCCVRTRYVRVQYIPIINAIIRFNTNWSAENNT